jgi:hypothetical protein
MTDKKKTFEIPHDQKSRQKQLEESKKKKDKCKKHNG